MTDNRITISILMLCCAGSMLVGIGGASLYFHSHRVLQNAQQSALPADDWIRLSTDSTEAISYSPDAAKSDIKLPSITSFSGKSKFVSDMARSKQDIKLGYVVDVDIAPLDASSIPDAYKIIAAANTQEKPTPTTAVDYNVVFYFILKDKDGFPLMKVASNQETIHSGSNNHFQFFARNYIPQPIASHTKMITVRMEAVKCLTCIHGVGASGEISHKRQSLFHL